MATLEDLHKSISSFSNETLLNFFKSLRTLRRELLPKTVRKTVKKKIDKEQKTVEQYITKIKKDEQEKLLEKLIEIRKRRK